MAASLLSALRASRSLLPGRSAILRAQTPKPHHHIRCFSTSLIEDDEGLLLSSHAPGQSEEKRLSKMWLRDNCLCEECVNQATMQKTYNMGDIPDTINTISVRQHEKGVDVTWSDHHESTYNWTWLRSALHGNEIMDLRGVHAIELWNSNITTNLPKISYAEVMDKDDMQGMAVMTNNIRRRGFCFVTDSPKTPEGTEKLLKAIGPIRNTHYGGFYDFVPDMAKADTAYTNMALAAHTDTTYFTEPAGLQAFHLLSHTPPPHQPGLGKTSLGGKSLLVDGFYVAHRMRKEFPTAYDVLRTIRIPWHASGNQDVLMSPDRAYPVLDASAKRLNRIRWNNNDRGAVPLHVQNIDEWYAAARKWEQVLHRSCNEYWFQLEPGQILIFDNWRILHGRSAFKGHRRICGGYINRDDFISRWQLSNFPREAVIRANTQRK